MQTATIGYILRNNPNESLWSLICPVLMSTCEVVISYIRRTNTMVGKGWVGKRLLASSIMDSQMTIYGAVVFDMDVAQSISFDDCWVAE